MALEIADHFCLAVYIVVAMIPPAALARSIEVKYWVFCGKTLIDCVCNTESQLSTGTRSVSLRISLHWLSDRAQL